MTRLMLKFLLILRRPKATFKRVRIKSECAVEWFLGQDGPSAKIWLTAINTLRRPITTKFVYFGFQIWLKSEKKFKTETTYYKFSSMKKPKLINVFLLLIIGEVKICLMKNVTPCISKVDEEAMYEFQFAYISTYTFIIE